MRSFSVGVHRAFPVSIGRRQVPGYRQRGLAACRTTHTRNVVKKNNFDSKKCSRVECSSNSEPGTGLHRVIEGDVVTIHYRCTGPNGQELDSSYGRGEPMTFEVGAGDVMGNKLFQGFDEAVRGMAKGETIVLEAQGGEWQRDLLFKVPRDHQEVQRLEGRYKSQGGLKQGILVELVNGQMAMVVELTDEAVTLDANSMLAGKTIDFELEVVDIQGV